MRRLELLLGTHPAVEVIRFAAEEALNAPFKVTVWARGMDGGLDLSKIVGHPASFRLETGGAFSPLGGARAWTGIVTSAEQEHGGLDGDLSTYHVVIEPALVALRYRSAHRLFQDASIPRVLRALTEELGVETRWQLDDEQHPSLELRVQYGETDLSFLQRLAEEAGIAIAFLQKEEGSPPTFADALEHGEPRAGSPIWYESADHHRDRECITSLKVVTGTRPTKVSVRDYDFRRPNYDLRAEAGAGDRERFYHRPDATLVGLDVTDSARTEDDRGVFRHTEGTAATLANRRLHAESADHRWVEFRMNTVDLWPGMVFAVAGHGEVGADEPWLCTRFSIAGAPNELYEMTGSAVSAKTPYEPPVVTKRPVIQGVQSATVVGPPGQEIHTDEFGRVRVKFAWDREFRSDDGSSGWIRLSQGWAGAQFGWFALPRVGQEVLVAFLDGNPDAPIVVGRLFNPTNPAPFPLPERAPRSTFRSRSSPLPNGRNELMFDDAEGAELVYQQAERNLRALVKRDHVVTVGGHRDRFVGNDDVDTTLGARMEATARDRFETSAGNKQHVTDRGEGHGVSGTFQERVDRSELVAIGGTRHAVTGGDKREEIRATSSLRVGGSHAEAVGTSSRTVGGGPPLGGEHIAVTEFVVKSGEDTHFKTNTDLEIQAPVILLKGPGGFIQIDEGGVTIEGSTVQINMGGEANDAPIAKPSGALPAKEAKVEIPPRPAPIDATLDDGVRPPRPTIRPEVAIKDATGLRDPARFIPAGRTQQYTASTSPLGGTVSWRVSGNGQISGPSDREFVVVESTEASSAVGDTELEVTYTTRAGSAKASIQLTAFHLASIDASQAATPSPTAAAEGAVRRTRSSTSDDTTFGDQTTTILEGSGEVAFRASSTPEGVPVRWRVDRADDDALQGAAPTALFGGEANEMRLLPDARGSFHVRAFVDTDRDGKWGREDVGLVHNLQIVGVDVAPSERHVFIDNGGFGDAGGDESTRTFISAPPGSWPLRAEVDARLIGGGPAATRGIDRVVLGFVQNALGRSLVARYADESVVTSTPVYGETGEPITQQSEPFMTRAHPLRAGGGPSGIGADAFTGGAPSTVGRDRHLTFAARPVESVLRVHPVTGSALAALTGVDRYLVHLCAFSRDFDGTLTVLASFPWWVDYAAKDLAAGYDPSSAAIRAPARLEIEPPQPAAAVGVEPHPPDVASTLRSDAR